MLIVSVIVHTFCKNVFPMGSDIIDRGHISAVIVLMAPVLTKILFENVNNLICHIIDHSLDKSCIT